MKFLAITLITHTPDPVSGAVKPTTARLREVIGNAVLAEQLGFDGFGVGERHERPFISSSPPVVHRYHGELGHEVMHLHADADGLTDAQHRDSLELFMSEIAPVLRRRSAHWPRCTRGGSTWASAGPGSAARRRPGNSPRHRPERRRSRPRRPARSTGC